MPDTVAETLKNFFNLGGSDMQETLPDRLSNMILREKLYCRLHAIFEAILHSRNRNVFIKS